MMMKILRESGLGGTSKYNVGPVPGLRHMEVCSCWRVAVCFSTLSDLTAYRWPNEFREDNEQIY